MRLNKEDHFGIVIGMPGVSFEQAGRYFRTDGTEVGEDGLPIVSSEPDPPAPLATYAAMSNKQMQAMVAQFGGTWTTREAAIEFLSKGGE